MCKIYDTYFSACQTTNNTIRMIKREMSNCFSTYKNHNVNHTASVLKNQIFFLLILGSFVGSNTSGQCDGRSEIQR